MKKLIGIVSAVFFVLFVTGPAFASEIPMEETIEQDMQTLPESETVAEEDTSASETLNPATQEDTELPDGAESPLAVWSSIGDQVPAGQPGEASPIDSVKVDLSVDPDGQTFMPLNE